MKKSLLLLVILFTIKVVLAQDVLQPKEAFCQIVGIYQLLSDQLTIEIDYGDYLPVGKNRELTDDEGRKLQFNSMMHALNFMNAHGWEYIDAYVVTRSNTNIYHYTLKKPFNELTKEGQNAMIKELNDITVREK